jgi:Holliday junction resolvase-like predicted endonuclease
LVPSLLKRAQQNLSWRDLEELVANLFELNGYEIVHRNVFDGEGGDADIIATYRLPIVSEHAGTDHKVYIQVKHKEGRDWDDAKGVEQLHQISKLEPNVQKILISTADDFLKSTRALTSEQDVILINGANIEMMTKHL